MNFDLGDVLTRALQITWKNKVLWLIGIAFGFLTSMVFPLMFSPMLFPLLTQDSRINMRSAPGFMIGFIVLLFLFFVALYPIGVLTQSSLTLGILNADRADSENLSAMDLLKRSRPFFWRVLGLMILFAVAMGLINLLIQAIVFLLTILTMGIATICMMPLMLLMYPALFGAMVWMEQSMNGIVVDNMSVMEAVKQGWNLIRHNLLPMSLLALVVYFGVGLVTGILILPMMMPLFFVQFSFLEHQTNWTILLASVLWTVAFIPLFAILTGISMVFTKSTWVLTYLRLRRSPKLQPLPQIAGATS